MSKRLRNYAFILYQESVPENWRTYLEMLHVPCAISPLHDKDLKEDGTPKKAHWHVIFAFQRMKTVEQVLSLVEPFGIHHVEPVHDLKAYTRYLVHMDSPEKAQYDQEGIVTLSGFDLGVMTQLTASEARKIGNEIRSFIREANITEYADLLDYCQDNGLVEWDTYATSHTVMLNSYLASIRNRK